MKSLDEFTNPGIRLVFTDIDDTLTQQGQLQAEAYSALWQLKKNGIKVVPVTGRPAGWCELIARQWPVDGVVGENGGFYFRYSNREMKRHYVFNEEQRLENRKNLNLIRDEILAKIPGVAVASDQFCRLMDLAIDFCEDVPAVPREQVLKVVKIFESHGAQAKVSSIHVNGWFGDYNKLSMCKEFAKNELQMDLKSSQKNVAFVGDSPNDEPLFEFFENSFAVANISDFEDLLVHKPRYKLSKNFGLGFEEFVQNIT